MKADGDVITMVDSGLFTLSKNPWESGKLASYAREYGFTIKTRKILKRTAPWAKARGGVEALSEKQRSKLAEFMGVVYKGIQKDLDEGRKPRPASVYIKQAYPVRMKREYKSKVTEESLARLSAKIKMMRGEELTEQERRLLGIAVIPAARGRGALEVA
jgi:hypothetical protein